jgi:hypothetical protein
LRGWLRGDEVLNLDARTSALVTAGAPEGLARRVADLLHVFPYLDIADLAHRLDRPFAEVAQVYFVTSSRLRVPTHVTAVSRLERRDRPHALARLALREDLYASPRSAAADVLTTTPEQLPADERVTRWEEGKSPQLRSVRSSGALLEDPRGGFREPVRGGAPDPCYEQVTSEGTGASSRGSRCSLAVALASEVRHSRCGCSGAVVHTAVVVALFVPRW